MATATTNVETTYQSIVTTVEVPVETKTYTLELDEREANTLAAILAKVGGNPSTTPRGYAQRIMGALEREGVYFYHPENGNGGQGWTRFTGVSDPETWTPEYAAMGGSHSDEGITFDDYDDQSLATGDIV